MNHVTMPAYTSPGFPVNFLFYLGFSAPLSRRVAERVDAPGLPCSLAFVGRTPHESLLDAAQFLPSVDVAEQRRLRLSSGCESGCGPVDQLDLEGRRFVDHACPTKYACIAVANSSAESPVRFRGQLCHNLDVAAEATDVRSDTSASAMRRSAATRHTLPRCAVDCSTARQFEPGSTPSTSPRSPRPASR